MLDPAPRETNGTSIKPPRFSLVTTALSSYPPWVGGFRAQPLTYRLEFTIEDLQRCRGKRILLSRMPEVKRWSNEEIRPWVPRKAIMGSPGSGPRAAGRHALTGDGTGWFMVTVWNYQGRTGSLLHICSALPPNSHNSDFAWDGPEPRRNTTGPRCP